MSARVVDVTAAVVRLQTGYVYHYAFAMLIGVAALSPGTCSAEPTEMMYHLLTGLLVLPLAGALFILITRGDTEAGQKNIRWIALWPTVVTFLVSLVAWGRFDIANPASSSWRTAHGSPTPSASSSASTASRCRSSC